MISKTITHTSNSKILLILLILVTLSISIRLYFLPFETPFKTDALDYFSFAFETSKTHQFPSGIIKTNDGWPLFLHPIFSIIGQSDMMTLINAQRITSIIFSSLSIIPVYFLCKKFVSPKFSLIGASLFGFNHKLIENSILGVTEPLFIFLIIFVLIFSLDNNKKLFFLSFIFLALSSIVRYEALLYIIPLSIIFFIRFRKEKNYYIKFPIFILIFILILLPTATIRIESNDVDGLTSHTLNFITTPSTSYLSNLIATSPDLNAIPDPGRPTSIGIFISNLFSNTLKFLVLALIPIFIILSPIGLYYSVKNRNHNIAYLIMFSIFMILPAMYAYGRDMQDTRYLFILFPIFSVLSIYGLSIFKNVEQKKILISIILIIIFSYSILAINDQPDYVYSNEIYIVTKNIIENADGVNNYPGNSYVKIATLEKYWPNSLPIGNVGYDTKITFFIKKIPTESFSTLEEYLKESKDKNLTHLVVTEKNNSLFLDKLLLDYSNYPYLEKTFDSSNYNFQNQIIILKINYPLFEQITT